MALTCEIIRARCLALSHLPSWAGYLLWDKMSIRLEYTTGVLGTRPTMSDTNVDVPSAAKGHCVRLLGTGLCYGDRDVGCARSTRPHPEIWLRVTWTQRSRWGGSLPCAATRKGLTHTLPAQSLALPRSLPFPTALTFDLSQGLPHRTMNKSHPSDPWAKGIVQLTLNNMRIRDTDPLHS